MRYSRFKPMSDEQLDLLVKMCKKALCKAELSHDTAQNAIETGRVPDEVKRVLQFLGRVPRNPQNTQKLLGAPKVNQEIYVMMTDEISMIPIPKS